MGRILERIRSEGLSDGQPTGSDLRDQTARLLDDKKELEEFRGCVQFLDNCETKCSDAMIEEQVTNEVLNRMKPSLKKPLREYLIPRTRTEKLADLFSILWTVGFLASGNPIASLGLIGLAVHKSYRSLQWLGVIPDGYDGIRWPYYIADVDPRILEDRLRFYKNLLD